VLFELGDENFALHIDQLDEIASVQKGTALPHLHAALMGLMNLRGNTFLLVDTAQAIGLRLSTVKTTADQRVLIVKDPQGVQTGLLVDKVSTAISMQSIDFKSFTTQDQTKNHFVSEIGRWNNKSIGRFDLTHLLNSVNDWAAG
jgi:purine-binding chemotaxis protein CheW